MKPTRLTLGTVQLGIPYGVANRTGMPTLEESFAILDAAVDAGVRSFDTAPGYGLAEERVGAFLRERGLQDVVVTTKLPSLGGIPSGEIVGAVARAVEASLSRLGRVDHYLLHDAADLRCHGSAVVDALTDVQRRGLVGAIGVSAYGVQDVRLALEHAPLRSVQVPLNLLDQRLITSGVMARLHEAGVTVFARSAYLQGLFALDVDALPSRVSHARPWLVKLRDELARYGVKAVEVALAYAGAIDGVTSVVVGAETAAQIRESALRVKQGLPEGLIELVRVAFATVDEAVIDPSQWPREPSAKGAT